MKSLVSSLLVGFLFAIGLGVSGMTQPEKVVSFLDVFEDWDPSLIFVMGGALLVHTILYRLITKRKTPLFAEKFQIPTRRDINLRLVLGAMLFGLGWGLAGYCPAPAITSLGALTLSPIVFVVSMLVGMMMFLAIDKRFISRKDK